MKQSIISIGMTAANIPAHEERPNILFFLSVDLTSQWWGI